MTTDQTTSSAACTVTPPAFRADRNFAILKDAERNLQKTHDLLLIADNLHAQDDGALAYGIDTDTLAGLIEDIEDRIEAALVPGPQLDNEFCADETDAFSQAISILYCARALVVGAAEGIEGTLAPWRSRWAGSDASVMYLLKAARGLIRPILLDLIRELETEGAEVVHGQA